LYHSSWRIKQSIRINRTILRRQSRSGSIDTKDFQVLDYDDKVVSVVDGYTLLVDVDDDDDDDDDDSDDDDDDDVETSPIKMPNGKV